MTTLTTEEWLFADQSGEEFRRRYAVWREFDNIVFGGKWTPEVWNAADRGQVQL